MPQQVRAGFPTYWTIKGTGKRQVMLIHCSLAHSGAWNGVVKALGPDTGMRFTVFDIPGHGRSGDRDGRGDIQAISTEIAADLIDGAADVIGHSFGATVALRLAVEQPDKVSSLVMIEPVFFAAAKLNGRWDDRSFAQEYQQNLAGRIVHDAERATKDFANIWGTGQAWQDIEPDQRRYMVERIHLIPCADAQLYEDRAGLLSRLAEIAVPVTLIKGENSPPIMTAVCDALAARIAGVQRVTIRGAGHMAPITHPVETAVAIADFLGFTGKD